MSQQRSAREMVFCAAHASFNEQIIKFKEGPACFLYLFLQHPSVQKDAIFWGPIKSCLMSHPQLLFLLKSLSSTWSSSSSFLKRNTFQGGGLVAFKAQLMRGWMTTRNDEFNQPWLVPFPPSFVASDRNDLWNKHSHFITPQTLVTYLSLLHTHTNTQTHIHTLKKALGIIFNDQSICLYCITRAVHNLEFKFQFPELMQKFDFDFL